MPKPKIAAVVSMDDLKQAAVDAFRDRGADPSLSFEDILDRYEIESEDRDAVVSWVLEKLIRQQ